MAQPNANKKLNFVPKVKDPVTGEFVPLYVAPDATDTVQGDVKLSDAVDSTANAATGMTAASPRAVKTVQDNANNKLDKTTNVPQTVESDVTFNGGVTVNELTGNASTATKIKTPVTITIKSSMNSADDAVVNFDGSNNIILTLNKIATSLLEGIIPLENIPQAAIERLIKVPNEAARFALATDNVQLGDSVLQLDTGVMYVVVDTAKLDVAAGYQEYQAGTAASVPWTGVTGTTGAITADNINDSVKYAEADEKNGAALSIVWNSF